MTATIADVAAKAGVSTATVSRVLAGVGQAAGVAELRGVHADARRRLGPRHATLRRHPAWP